MTIAYFDCFSGAAGDMIVGALLDAGADPNALRRNFDRLGVGGFRIEIEKTTKQGLSATRFQVHLDPAAKQPHRHLKHITEIIRQANFAPRVTERAVRIFERLAQAEAQVHNTTIEKVHFHEVGAIDAIVDVVGACLCLEQLDPQRIYCSPIPTGNGTVKCEHGVLPVPAPATALLLLGIPLAECAETGELTTPTGAAILTTLVDEFRSLPPMRIRSIGYGAGTRDNQTRPNVLRVLLGEPIGASPEAEEITVLETNLDDASPQLVGYCIEKLLAEGALDAFAVPIQMKKGRPGVLLTVLADIDRVSAMERILFSETPTFGIRRRTVQRTRLPRRFEAVPTPFGDIRIKIGEAQGLTTATPEYEDCKAAARRHGVALREVLAAAMTAWNHRRP